MSANPPSTVRAGGWVLGGQADDQLLDVVVQRWSSVAAMWVGPRAGDQAAMPAPQGVRGDEEARPAVAWEDAADCGEHGAVGGFQPGSWELASEDGELLAQDEDLQILGDVAAASRARSWMERHSVR
jgi:hypothetical protein